MSNKSESLESFRHPFTVFVVSFFLQTHTSLQHEIHMQKRNSSMSHFINSIKRKLPDRIDIFNKKSETEFVEIMKLDFNRIIDEEYKALMCFLPSEIADNTINDNFNFTHGSDFGNISLSNLQYLVKQCFFSDWVPLITDAYQIFVQGVLKEGEQQTGNLIDSETKINTSSLQQQQLPFSLRNFLVSIVLMSHCTIYEKFDILYDLFDWNDGFADGLDLNSMVLLIKTIFERNLYYWPSHELYNLVEISFDLSVSSIYKAYWTSAKDLQNIHFNSHNYKKLVDCLNNILDQDSIDVTEEVQDTLNSYQRMFGNKIIDFNYDSSAFRDIGTLIKRGREMIELTNRNGLQFKLVIFYQVSSERYLFEVNYDRDGFLFQQKDMLQKQEIDEYLKRNINKLYLQGRSKGISKDEFFTKTVGLPFLHDLIRVETLYQDRLHSSFTKKKKLSKELVVLLNHEELSFIFRFQARVMQNVEGDIQMLDHHTYRVLMMEANEQDVVSDIRYRITLALKKISLINTFDVKLLMEQVQRSFFIKEGQNWRVIKEFDRLIRFDSSNSDEIMMKLEKLRHDNSNEEQRDLAGFDCYSLYKHSDMSYEWRLCKIMQKELIVQSQSNKLVLELNKTKEYYYWIEYLHHRKSGSKLWLKRKREEILVSARYSREQQRNYEQETLKFVKSTYKEAFAI